jgi:hypothetical protein
MGVSATDVAVVLGAVAGTIGTVYAVRTFRRMSADAKRAEERHLAEIQPRPAICHAKVHLTARGGRLDIRYVNPGGAATRWVVVIHAGTFLFLYDGPCPAHFEMALDARIPIQAFAIGLPPNTIADARFIGSYATDIEGHAWDLIHEQRTELSSTEYFRQDLAPWGVGVDDDGKLYRLPGHNEVANDAR